MDLQAVLASRRLIVLICAIFGIKALAMIGFSYYEFVHGALNSDFAIFYQAWSLIAGGNLNPYSTMVGQFFYKDHFSILMWPLAVLGVLFRSPMTLKVVQDVAAAAADLIGALWIVDILRRESNVSLSAGLAMLITGIVCLFINPWTFYTDAFDFHFYTLSELFLIGSVWAFYRGNVLVGILCALGVSTGGDANATYAVGLGATVILASRKLWKAGLFVVLASLGAVLFMHKIGAGTGSGISTAYGYLSAQTPGSEVSIFSIARGIVQHPSAVFDAFWSDRLRVYANLGPSGFLGFFSPWAIGPWSVLLLENVLHRGLGGLGQSRFSLPGFQFGVGYALLTPATIWVIAWLHRRFRSDLFVFITSGLVTLNAIGWAAVWLPYMPVSWVTVQPALATELYRLERSTPDDVQITASQGVVGDLSGRRYVGQFFGQFKYTVYSKSLRIVLTPYSGIETASVEESAGAIASLLDSKRSQIIRASNLLWVIDYALDGTNTTLPLGYDRPMLPAAVFTSDVGYRVVRTNASDSSLQVDGSNPSGGYLLRGAYFRRAPGNYTVSVMVRASTPVVVEVQDASKGVLMVKQTYQSHKLSRLNFRLQIPYSGGDDLYDGYWPFYSPAWRSTTYDSIEVRVWAPPHTTAEVRMVGISGHDMVRR